MINTKEIQCFNFAAPSCNSLLFYKLFYNWPVSVGDEIDEHKQQGKYVNDVTTQKLFHWEFRI